MKILPSFTSVVHFFLNAPFGYIRVELKWGMNRLIHLQMFLILEHQWHGLKSRSSCQFACHRKSIAWANKNWPLKSNDALGMVLRGKFWNQPPYQCKNYTLQEKGVF